MRTEKALKNIITSIASYCLILVLGLLSRRLLLQSFDTELVGYDSLLSNIFSIIAVADFGTDGLFTYRLYAAFAKEDRQQVGRLLGAYRSMCFFLSGLIAAICVILFFFLPYIFAGKVKMWGYFRLMYILYSILAVSAYFFRYWRVLFVADQMEYKAIRAETLLQMVCLVTKVAVLWFVRSYLVYVFIAPVFTILEQAAVRIIARRDYRDIKPQKVSFSIYREEGVFQEISQLVSIKLFNTLNVSTDSLLISLLIDIPTMTFYSNYILIGNSVLQLFYKAIWPLGASVANLLNRESRKVCQDFFRTMDIVCFFLASIIYAGFLTVFQSAVSVFFGPQFLLPLSFVFAYAVYAYIGVKNQTAAIFRGAYGEFSAECKFTSVGAIINLVASIILSQFWGIAGIETGTILACILIWFGRIYITEKKALQSPIFLHIRRELLFFILASGEAAFTWWMARNIAISLSGMLVRCVISVTVPTVINVVIFGRTEAFKNAVFRFQGIIARRRNPNAE